MPTTTPLIPTRFLWLALIIGAALLVAAYFLPLPWQGVAMTLGGLAMYLAGKGFVPPKWAVGKVFVPVAFVPVLLAMAEGLQFLAPGLPADVAPHVGAFAGLLALLAGKVEPVPVKMTVNGTTVTGAPVAVDQACDLEDAGRGLCK